MPGPVIFPTPGDLIRPQHDLARSRFTIIHANGKRKPSQAIPSRQSLYPSHSRHGTHSHRQIMDQAVAKKTLQDLIKTEELENKRCIDCNNPNPQWASLRSALIDLVLATLPTSGF